MPQKLGTRMQFVDTIQQRCCQRLHILTNGSRIIIGIACIGNRSLQADVVPIFHIQGIFHCPLTGRIQLVTTQRIGLIQIILTGALHPPVKVTGQAAAGIVEVIDFYFRNAGRQIFHQQCIQFFHIIVAEAVTQHQNLQGTVCCEVL